MTVSVVTVSAVTVSAVVDEVPAPDAAKGSTMAAPSLHVPDEPIALLHKWKTAVLDGEPPSTVAGGDGGVADWLWPRWRTLEGAGLDREGLREICRGYRREIWLWLEGDRTWGQCCSALIGRIGRRLPTSA